MSLLTMLLLDACPRACHIKIRDKTTSGGPRFQLFITYILAKLQLPDQRLSLDHTDILIVEATTSEVRNDNELQKPGNIGSLNYHYRKMLIVPLNELSY